MTDDELKGAAAELAANPGSRLFVDVAAELLVRKRFSEAMDICFAGLSATPDMHPGRIVLARIFWERGFTIFAAREVRDLAAALPENETVKKLLAKLAPGERPADQGTPSQTQSKEIIAEADFDLGDLTSLGELDKKI